MESCREQGLRGYFVAIFDSLHHLHIKIFKLVRKYIVSSSSFGRMTTGRWQEKIIRLLKFEHRYSESAVCCSALYKVMRSCWEPVKTFQEWGLQMDATEYLRALTYLGCYEAGTTKHYTTFLFVVAFSDQCTKYERRFDMRRVHTRYSETFVM